MSKPCDNCGAEVPEGASICDNCGTPVSEGERPRETPARETSGRMFPVSPPPGEAPLQGAPPRRRGPLADNSAPRRAPAPPPPVPPPLVPPPPAIPGAERQPIPVPPRREERPLGRLLVLAAGLVVALLALGVAVWFLVPYFRSGGDTLEVPSLEGGTLETARQMVGENFEIVGDGAPQDVIQSQDPEPGERAERGSEISVVVDAGEVASVPDVLGRTQEEAEEILRSEGFDVEVETREGPEGLAGNVLEQNPSAGEAEAGAAVRIVVGRAPSPEEEPPPEETAPEHNALQDPTGALSVEVPTSWGVETGADSEKDVENAGSWSNVVGYLITSSITAAANLHVWNTGEGQPTVGVYIVASRELAETHTDDDLLSSGPFAGFAETCDAGPYEDFDRPPYSGKARTWYCAGGAKEFYTVAAAPEGRECVVLLQTSIPSDGASEADREAIRHILDSFEADCAAVVDAP